MNRARPKLSVGIIARNEQQHIRYCLESIRPIADEIIFVDTGSQDATVKIAKQYGARVIHYKWNNNYSKARNIYIRNASHEWILSIDADETLAKKDLSAIRNLLSNSDIGGYEFNRRTYTSVLNYAFLWRPNDGKYPREEKESKCPGYAHTQQTRLFRNQDYFYDEKVRVHEDIKPTIQAHGGLISKVDVTVHDFSCLKGHRFNIQKNRKYFRLGKAESKHRRLDELAHLNLALYRGLSLGRNLNQSIYHLKEALKLNQTNPDLHYLLALVHREKKWFKPALSRLKKVLKMEPQYADAWWLSGVCYDEMGLGKKAEVHLRKALQIVPKHPLFLNSWGVVNYNLGDSKEARQAFKKSTHILPQFTQARKNLAALSA